MSILAQPPTEPVEFPAEVWNPLMTALSWLLWIGIIVCVAALITCGAILVNQRKSTGVQIVETATLARILLCATVIGSSSGLAQAVMA
ncbi:hypothetical protein HQ308_14825 [Rhodococcus sp. BP-241]|uniref:hypothetical protein n=1 Tax=Rhodococcus sp. BP-241 TaxID=2739441 RepID=UPI001C9B6368|nr:hypothetical protein [Rhodococcus sp. BP-241]MBY6708077.1 hypothetical protein [Rhodococcus sp. BP-241]